MFTAFASPAEACVQPSALQRYDVEDLWVFGIYRNPHSRLYEASVGDPGGYQYEVSVGSRIGKSYGKVTRIAACRIFFTELKSDGAGGWVEANRSLRFFDPMIPSQSKCPSGPGLSTDVVGRKTNEVPAEVTKKLTHMGLADFVLDDRIDRGQFLVWTAYPNGVRECREGGDGVSKLVIFHKSSHAVDVISGP